MKTTIKDYLCTVLFTLVFILNGNIFAQAPQAFSFQAIVRDASGKLLVNSPVGVKITIREGSFADYLGVYSETHTVTSNVNGLITLEIGMGNNQIGSMNNINWNGGNTFGNQHYIHLEIDPTGGTNYTISNDNDRLVSVPTALYAEKSGDNKWASNEINIYNTNTGAVCLGTTTPINQYTGLTLSKNTTGWFGQYINAGANGIPFYGFSINGVSKAWTEFNASANKWSLYNGNLSISSSYPDGNVGIGSNPTSDKLYVEGRMNTSELQVRNGAGTGKVLTSDATGNATWQALPATTVVQGFAGHINGISGNTTLNAFAGPTVQITITSPSQKIIACANAEFSLTNGQGPLWVEVDMCYKSTSDAQIHNFIENNHYGATIQTSSTSVGVSATVTGLFPGTYDIGFGIKNSNLTTIGGNYVNGWVIVLP